MSTRLPVCAPCGREMQRFKNDTSVMFMAEFGPHEVWFGDTWTCTSCRATVIAGWGEGPIWRNHPDEPPFDVDHDPPDVVVALLIQRAK